MVGHTFIYNDAVRFLRRMIDAGDLGDIVYMYSQRLNLGQLRSDVNAWWNLAPHDISIQLHLAGDHSPLSVSATGRAFLQPGIEDVVMANLAWESGLLGGIHVSWLDPHKTRQLTVVGTRKMVVYDDASDNKIAIFEKGFDPVPRIGERMDFDNPSMIPSYKQRQGDIVIPHLPVREPLSVEIDHFLDCVATGRTPDTDGRHARAVVETLEAGQRSMRGSSGALEGGVILGSQQMELA
jgi:predicted dehydrogenase